MSFPCRSGYLGAAVSPSSPEFVALSIALHSDEASRADTRPSLLSTKTDAPRSASMSDAHQKVLGLARHGSALKPNWEVEVRGFEPRSNGFLVNILRAQLTGNCRERHRSEEHTSELQS